MAPARGMAPELRTRLLEAALSIVQACHYSGAGTVEFLVGGDSLGDGAAPFFFLELNPRLQVTTPHQTVSVANVCADTNACCWFGWG